MLVLLIIIVAVLIGLAYADYCLIDNTAHFGITFTKVAEAEEARTALEAAFEAAKEKTAEFDESEVLVPPAADVPELLEAPAIAARGRNKAPANVAKVPPPRRPGSGGRRGGAQPVLPSVDAGVAAIGN